MKPQIEYFQMIPAKIRKAFEMSIHGSVDKCIPQDRCAMAVSN
jgi:hypothetical protein